MMTGGSGYISGGSVGRGRLFFLPGPFFLLFAQTCYCLILVDFMLSK